MEIKQILKGWGNFVLKELDLLSEDTRILGEQRALICAECPMRTVGKCDKNKTMEVHKDFIYSGTSRTKGEIVHGCGCPIEKKIYSDAQCPIGNW